MFWWIFFSALVSLLLVLLFAPFKLNFNSINNIYSISWGNVLKASASLETDDISFRISLFGLGKNSSLLQVLAKKRKPKAKRDKKGKVAKKTSRKKIPFRFIISLIKSFRVKQFYINLDFHSAYWNAWIYPLGEIFRKDNFYISTNYSGKTEVDIEIINRPAWMLWAVIKTRKNNTL